jgi:hypothetical protein
MLIVTFKKFKLKVQQKLCYHDFQTTHKFWQEAMNYGQTRYLRYLQILKIWNFCITRQHLSDFTQADKSPWKKEV